MGFALCLLGVAGGLSKNPGLTATFASPPEFALGRSFGTEALSGDFMMDAPPPVPADGGSAARLTLLELRAPLLDGLRPSVDGMRGLLLVGTVFAYGGSAAGLTSLELGAPLLDGLRSSADGMRGLRLVGIVFADGCFAAGLTWLELGAPLLDGMRGVLLAGVVVGRAAGASP